MPLGCSGLSGGRGSFRKALGGGRVATLVVDTDRAVLAAYPELSEFMVF